MTQIWTHGQQGMLTHEWSFNLLVTKQPHCGFVLVVSIKGIKSCLECAVGGCLGKCFQRRIAWRVSNVGKLCQERGQHYPTGQGPRGMKQQWTREAHARAWPWLRKLELCWCCVTCVHQSLGSSGSEPGPVPATLQEAPQPSAFNWASLV